MTVEHKFAYKGTNTGWGKDIQTWVNTLSSEEQAEFSEAVARNAAMEQALIDAGCFTIAQDGSKVWASEAVFLEHINSMSDPQWKSYWTRWRTETGANFVATAS